jgi:hypothetical protein
VKYEKENGLVKGDLVSCAEKNSFKIGKDSFYGARGIAAGRQALVEWLIGDWLIGLRMVVFRGENRFCLPYRG